MASRAKKKRAWKENEKIRQHFEDSFIKASPQSGMTRPSSEMIEYWRGEALKMASFYRPPRVD